MTGRSRSTESSFDVFKAIASVAYLVDRTGATMYPVMKMLYLADKLHLETYGRFIAGDSYAAMEQGPVPSCTYNMMKAVRGEKVRTPGVEVACDYFSYGSDHSISLKRPVDLDELSDSDIRCLENIASLYRVHGSRAVREMSHDDAWTKVWKPNRKFRGSKSYPMPLEEIAAHLDGSEALLRHLADPQPGSR